MRGDRMWVRAAGILVGAFVALCSAVDGGAAQSYPSRPIRLVMPFGAGSASDSIARIVAERLPAGLGQGVLVEKKAGAGGTRGTAEIARAEPDGYSLIFAAPGPF